MALWNFGKGVIPLQKKTITISGYEIEEETGKLISVPSGQKEYILPKEVKQLTYSSLNNAQGTAILIDFSQTQLQPGNLANMFEWGFQHLREIKVPDSFETIAGILACTNIYRVKELFREHNRTINIPRGLKTFVCDNEAPWNKEIILPDGVREINGFGHNNCITKLRIPGTLEDKCLPPIFQMVCLKELIIGEGIEEACSMNRYYGLNHLEKVSIPSTLNTFEIGEFNRSTTYPDSKKDASGYCEELTITKAYDEASRFGQTTITFKLPRKLKVNRGILTIKFHTDKVTINDYSVSYDNLSPGGTYYIDHINKSMKQLSEGQPLAQQPNPNQINTKKRYQPAEHLTQDLEVDFDKKYLEFILRDIDRTVRETLLNSNGQINCISSQIVWAALDNAWSTRFLQHANLQPKDVSDSIPQIISKIKSRGIVFSPSNSRFHNLIDNSYVPVPNIYREITIIDYIITQLMGKLDISQLVDYLTKVMSEQDNKSNYLKINIQNLPLDMIGYAILITPSVLSRVITYYGINQLDKTSVIKYIEDLKTRNAVPKK